MIPFPGYILILYIGHCSRIIETSGFNTLGDYLLFLSTFSEGLLNHVAKQLHIATRMLQTNHPKTERFRVVSIIITHKSTVGQIHLLILIRPGWAFLWL